MKLFKKTLLATALVGASVAAQAELSANIGVTSEYFYRGATQSIGSAAVSGGIDYASDSGFYAGTWASSLGPSPGNEIDFYAGFSGGEDITFDIGYVYYHYSNFEPGIDFGEVYGSVGFGFLELGAAYTANNDSANDGGLFAEGDLAYWATLGGDVSEEWSASLTLGEYDFDVGFEYFWGQVDIGKSTDMGDFTLSLIDTDLPGQDMTAVVSWGIGF